MEPSGIGYRLNMRVGRKVVIYLGDGRELAFAEVRDGLTEFEIRIEVRIMSTTPVSRPPAGVQRQLHQTNVVMEERRSDLEQANPIYRCFNSAILLV